MIKDTIKKKEFDWLKECTQCNPYCCRNQYGGTESDVACTKPSHTQTTGAGYDNRPLECRLFPFDVIPNEGKLTWVKWDSCHASIKLNYEKQMDFFERKFSREFSLEQIHAYANTRKLESEGEKKGKYMIIREINWPTIKPEYKQ